MSETKTHEASMTPPDPVEEKLREMVAAALSEVRSIGPGAKRLELDFRAAGVPALLADNQSKDKRIAELEGALWEIRKLWTDPEPAQRQDVAYQRAVRIASGALTQPHALEKRKTQLAQTIRLGCLAVAAGKSNYDAVADAVLKLLAGTGVASDGGEDGE